MLSSTVYTALQRGILAHLWQLWMGQEAVDLFLGLRPWSSWIWASPVPQDTCLIPEIRPGLLRARLSKG